MTSKQDAETYWKNKRLDRYGDGIEEFDVWLGRYDMDHLQDGAPVYKPVGDDTLLVIRHDPDAPPSGSENG